MIVTGINQSLIGQFDIGSSLVLASLKNQISEVEKTNLLNAEIRWHYSQHLLAENRGEEVIEDMLLLTNNKKQRSLLVGQLTDEKHHAKIFLAGVNSIGLDERAFRYADGYRDLVKVQNTFSEKVFVFQILTEAISAAYCDWRILNIKNEVLNSIDHEVAKDEKRHLVMGKTLLSICDQDELRLVLTVDRQKELIAEMNQLCEKTVRNDMMISLTGKTSNTPTNLDRFIAKSVIKEFRSIKQFLKSGTPEN